MSNSLIGLGDGEELPVHFLLSLGYRLELFILPASFDIKHLGTQFEPFELEDSYYDYTHTPSLVWACNYCYILAPASCVDLNLDFSAMDLNWGSSVIPRGTQIAETYYFVIKIYLLIIYVDYGLCITCITWYFFAAYVGC
jgi:hypothetical protein